MKRTISILTLICLVIGFACAQDARTLLKENPLRAANFHHCYEVPAISDTPAPEGYTPFYISHYGRHGCRTMTSMSSVTRVSHILDTLSKAGLLTAKGERLHFDYKTIEDAHKGMAGFLTQKGAKEHQGIARRMFQRYTSVFKQSDRPFVEAASSIFPRCIQSMANFTMELKANAPGLDISLYTGDKYMDYILKEPSGVRNPRHKAIMDSIRNAVFDPSRVINEWFTEPAKAVPLLHTSDASQFAYYVFYTGGIVQCLDEEGLPNIFSYFTADELYKLWYIDNCNCIDQCDNTIENGSALVITGRAILNDILRRADEAVSGNGRAADLRFGHDSGLLPLLNLLRTEGNEEVLSMTEPAEKEWYCFQQMPMASSLQLIFYSSEKDGECDSDHQSDILVKILRNEVETTIPSLTPFTGPYYRWKDLRSYFTTLLKD